MKRKLLLVEDNVLLSKVVVDAFDLIGFDVEAVQHGAEAIALAEGGNFDAALVDLELGQGPTGLEVVQALRNLKAAIPVVLSTGYNASAIDAPAGVPVVGKPYRPEEIADLLAAAWEQRGTPLANRRQ